MLGSMKAFLCLHGFGNHSGGRRPGFSAALRRAVEARLGAKTVWKEVLWDGLLGSPDSFGTLDLALQTPALARAFYEGREGDAVRARIGKRYYGWGVFFSRRFFLTQRRRGAEGRARSSSAPQSSRKVWGEPSVVSRGVRSFFFPSHRGTKPQRGGGLQSAVIRLSTFQPGARRKPNFSTLARLWRAYATPPVPRLAARRVCQHGAKG